MGLKVTEVGNRKTERGLQLGRREEGQYRRENIRTNSIRNHISLYLAMIIHIIHTHYTTHTLTHTYMHHLKGSYASCAESVPHKNCRLTTHLVPHMRALFSNVWSR